LNDGEQPAAPSAPSVDVTEMVEARQVQRSRDELEQLVEERTADRDRLWQLSTDLLRVNRFDGVITAVNPAWTAVLGWTERELIGRNIFDLIHPDDLDRSAGMIKSLSEGATITRFDNRYRHKDGGYRWISWTAAPGGGLVNAVGRDFTAEKRRRKPWSSPWRACAPFSRRPTCIRA
jgi:PAS domain S-box-containing protein